MPKTTRDGDAKQSEIPSTLQRSDEKAQRTFAKAYDAAREQYGSEERARRVAFAALKHTHEKIGDHWEPKDEPGPSDDRAEEGGLDASADTAGGVDANATKAHLLDVARRLDVDGRSTMTKDELVEAIQRANDRATRRARGD
ncbi:cation transport regulator ChaB [Cellulosimicrobium cellulans]|uniref:ChaB family protein n=1 Tax=Cellulosimicrobium cellulans TaxID=1710 RepID=UPI0018840BF3|nr:ChaB family protein [Cellulosimicrobium cellulans]MBE9924644.1 cation transport regulator ChaB [Cellulosimicrobium cellulans]